MVLGSAFAQPVESTIVYQRPPESNIVVVEKTELREELIPICKCESGSSLPHYGTDGELLRGVINPLDRGRCQINEKYWGEFAEKQGWDWLNNESDYNKLANRIYEENGSQPWFWSQSCWGRQ